MLGLDWGTMSEFVPNARERIISSMLGNNFFLQQEAGTCETALPPAIHQVTVGKRIGGADRKRSGEEEERRGRGSERKRSGEEEVLVVRELEDG